MYTKEHKNQMTFSDQFFGHVDPVSEEHPYIRLEKSIDWDCVFEKFKEYYNTRIGRIAKSVKNMILLLLFKHLENISDEDVVIRLSTDLAMQKALNITFLEAQVKIKYIEKKKKRIKKVKGYIDPSLLTHFRKRIGVEGVKYLEDIVESFIKKKKLIRGRTVILDPTAVPSNILYPTDITLIEKSRQVLLRILKKFSNEKFRTYPRKARRTFLSYIKLGQKKRKMTRKVHGQMIRFTKRNLKQAKMVLGNLNNRTSSVINSQVKKAKELVAVIERMLEQQERIYKMTPRNGDKKGIRIKDRIVSIFRPHVRPIPRGKIPVPTEFGAKVLFEMRDGFMKPLMITFDNVADSEMIINFFERWKGLIVGADRGCHSPTNTKLAQEHGIKKYYVEKKGKKSLEKNSSLLRVRRLRSVIEAKIGLSKRKHGLRKNLYARGPDGEEQWIRLGCMTMNLKRAFSIL